MSADDGDTADRRPFHKNRGCCCATIISHLPVMKEETKPRLRRKEEMTTITTITKGGRSGQWSLSRWIKGGYVGMKIVMIDIK